VSTLFCSQHVHNVWGSSRVSFNLTLLITGVFAVAAGGSPNFVVLTSLVSVWSVGVGGNLPVDSSIFLGTSICLQPPVIWAMLNPPSKEFVPATHQYLLTILSIWWAFGQLFGSLVSYSCHKHPSPFQVTDEESGSDRLATDSQLFMPIRRHHMPAI